MPLSRALNAALALLLLAGLLDTAQGASVVPRGSRELGFDVLDTTPSSPFFDNLSRARSVGASYMILGLGWDQIEANSPGDCNTPGTYKDPYNGVLSALNILLPSQKFGLSLSISPISTNIDLRPTYLRSLPFDDPLTICRFNMMLDFVFSKIPNVRLVSLQLGNEIDAYPMATQVSFWRQYWNLFVNAAAKARKARNGVPVSVVGTLYGALGTSRNPLAKGGLKQLYSYADDVAVTYYPINTDYTIKSPTVISKDIGALVNLYPASPIYFNEIGFPSGSGGYAKSSLSLQQQFVQQVFQTWDGYASHITHINFVRLNDLNITAAQSMASNYGLADNAPFVEDLQTLGVRNYAGADKPAFSDLKLETSSRNW